MCRNGEKTSCATRTALKQYTFFPDGKFWEPKAALLAGRFHLFLCRNQQLLSYLPYCEDDTNSMLTKLVVWGQPVYWHLKRTIVTLSLELRLDWVKCISSRFILILCVIGSLLKDTLSPAKNRGMFIKSDKILELALTSAMPYYAFMKKSCLAILCQKCIYSENRVATYSNIEIWIFFI